MKNLSSLISESVLSDNEIWWRCGVNQLNAMPRVQVRKIVSKYNISKTNPREGVIKYMTDAHPPLPKDSEEFIKRSEWDLDGVIGETEGQLMHKDYSRMMNHIFSTHKRKHDLLTVFQCSSSKPYYNNNLYRYNWYNVYDDFTDFACISNPGTVPIEYSKYYPYRYDEWSVVEEKKINEVVDISHKYDIVNMCRFIRFVKKLGYKDVVVAMGNPEEQEMFDEMLKYNVANCKDWLHIVTNDSLRNSIFNHHADLKKVHGLAYSRTMNMPETRKRYERLLREILKDTEIDDFNKVVKARDEELKESVNESLKEPEYKILKHINYSEFISKFKDSIKDNKVKKDKLYYKTYYWTALDLLLMAMDGNLLEDIDHEYWDFFDKLVNDKDFLHMEGFLFCYKPLMERDKISEETIKDEGDTLKLIWKKPEFELLPGVFGHARKGT